MFALLSDLESLDSECTTEEKIKQLELQSNRLEAENFLIEKFLEKNEEKSTQPQNAEEYIASSNQFVSLQRKIDIAEKMRIAISNELDLLESKSSDKLRNLIATKSELDLSRQEVAALRNSIEQKFQMNAKLDSFKPPENFNKFIEKWSHNCKQKREKARLKAIELKRLCSREEEDATFKVQLMKQVTPVEYVKLMLDNKKCHVQLEELRVQISKCRKEHAIILSRKIMENRKSIEIAKMRRTFQTKIKTLQATDVKLHIECDQMVQTIAQIEEQNEEFRQRVDDTEYPHISVEEYAKCKDKNERLASIVKIVERKMSLSQRSGR